MAVQRTIQRGLYAYSIHGRGSEGVLDYPMFFAALAGVPAIHRQTSVGEEFVALSVMEPLTNGWVLRFVTGRKGVPPLTFDPETGQETYEDLGHRIVANASWAVVRPKSRFVIVEKRRPGVSAQLVAQTLSHLGRELGLAKDLVVDLNPIVSESFATELDRFERIRQASIVLARPNIGWMDNAQSNISVYAAESDASTAEVRLSAIRGGSLSREGGIIADIKTLIQNRIAPLKDLKVVGRRMSESKETTLSLKKHQERSFTVIEPGMTTDLEKDATVVTSEALLDVLDRLQSENG